MFRGGDGWMSFEGWDGEVWEIGREEKGRSSVLGSELFCVKVWRYRVWRIRGIVGGLCGYRMECEMEKGCGVRLGSSRKVLSVKVRSRVINSVLKL